MTVHPTAARGFVRPDVYERGRAGYPQAAVDALGLTPASRVLDLGCGTGKLTAQLAATGAHVIGIDPLPSMLGAMHERYPSIPAGLGLAEALPARDGAFDLVICASAFHWFDHATALPEIRRVLRTGGRLATIWNRRDELTGWPKEFWDLTESYRGDTPGYRSGEWRLALESSGLFGPITEQVFPHTQIADRQTILDRVLSASFIELLPDETKQRVLADCSRFLDTHPETRERDTLELPYRTTLYVCERV